MPLLNYTTKIPADKTAGEIMSLLAAKGASHGRLATTWSKAGVRTSMPGTRKGRW